VKNQALFEVDSSGMEKIEGAGKPAPLNMLVLVRWGFYFLFPEKNKYFAGGSIIAYLFIC
jgi:hypothetical protein